MYVSVPFICPLATLFLTSMMPSPNLIICACRWKLAVKSLISTQRLVKYLRLLKDRVDSSPSDRFFACVQLERELAGNPRKAALMQGAQETLNREFKGSLSAGLFTEMLLTGEKLFDL